MVFRKHLFAQKLPLLNRGMDAYSKRLQTTSKNIANATSPFYRPERVKFEEFFHQQEVVIKGTESGGTSIPVGRTSPNDVENEKENRSIPEPEIFFSGETHVNMDKEMSEMAQNQIRFRFASAMTKRFFGGLSSSIRGMSQG
jgi:flagellar basal-body rod protein FlgB